MLLQCYFVMLGTEIFTRLFGQVDGSFCLNEEHCTKAGDQGWVVGDE